MFWAGEVHVFITMLLLWEVPGYEWMDSVTRTTSYTTEGSFKEVTNSSVGEGGCKSNLVIQT